LESEGAHYWSLRGPGWSLRGPGWSLRGPGWSLRGPGWSLRGPATWQGWAPQERRPSGHRRECPAHGLTAYWAAGAALRLAGPQFRRGSGHSLRTEPARLAPSRTAPVRSAPERLAPHTDALDSVAPDRSALVSSACSTAGVRSVSAVSAAHRDLAVEPAAGAGEIKPRRPGTAGGVMLNARSGAAGQCRSAK
jgi:hypothetical protein